MVIISIIITVISNIISIIILILQIVFTWPFAANYNISLHTKEEKDNFSFK
jgi:hypothetical protein